MKNNKDYISNSLLLEEITKSKQQDKLTPELEKMFILLANRVIKKMKYYNPIDKEDCLSTAILQLFLNWRGFDLKYTNPFAYFTEICKRGIARGYNDLYKMKGDPDRKVKFLSISSGSNDQSSIYNL